MLALGFPASQLPPLDPWAHLPPVWACNAPALAVFQRMPWLPSAMGAFGLRWELLPMITREVRVKRRDRRELPDLLRHCEAVQLEWMAKRAGTP